MFKLISNFVPQGDQPQAIKKLLSGLRAGYNNQVLLGVTGSGKTYTMAAVIEKIQLPTLVISPNKTLAAQLYQELKYFFPENAVRYFVSYYDYYQPEAYVPVTDTYIEKDAKINDFIDQLRHAATQDALTRRDFIIVASVSCIYGLGDPEEYEKAALEIKRGQKIKRQKILDSLAVLQYERNDIQKLHGTFSVRGETIEIISPDGETVTKIELFGDEIDSIKEGRAMIGHVSFREVSGKKIFPAKHFVTPQEKLDLAIKNIRNELKEHLGKLRSAGKLLEAQRLEQRTNFDMEMLEKTGYVSGIENYSRQLSFRREGDPPSTLLDYLPKDTVFFIDESHMTIPQVRGMYKGDRSRKQVLVDYGFRLPSALDNRPLRFEEFEEKIGQTIFVSATPGPYELGKCGIDPQIFGSFGQPSAKAYGIGRWGSGHSDRVIEQLIRPTGLLEPEVFLRPAENQIEDAKKEIEKSVKEKERVLLVTLTKRLAEDITDYLLEKGIKAEYLHSEVKTIDRSKALEKLRKGDFDVLVGVNLLREGLDLPEVALVLILDSDKEGFLRNKTSLIQTIGRAARHTKGRAILYADIVTGSMQAAIDEMKRRRAIQEKYNKENNITPQAISKPIRKPFWLEEKKGKGRDEEFLKALFDELRNEEAVKRELERQMLDAANNLQFERAAELRDMLRGIS